MKKEIMRKNMQKEIRRECKMSKDKDIFCNLCDPKAREGDPIWMVNHLMNPEVQKHAKKYLTICGGNEDNYGQPIGVNIITERCPCHWTERNNSSLRDFEICADCTPIICGECKHWYDNCQHEGFEAMLCGNPKSPNYAEWGEYKSKHMDPDDSCKFWEKKERSEK